MRFYVPTHPQATNIPLIHSTHQHMKPPKLESSDMHQSTELLVVNAYIHKSFTFQERQGQQQNSMRSLTNKVA